MSGKLIVIEGSDASGKATQSELLYDKLKEKGYKVKKVSFPNYQSDSSALVRMYLNGDFGENPGDVNPYAASTFYAVDRYASYKMDWKDFYLGGGIVIADRYTTSNMIHQAAKFQNLAEKDGFLQWLWELEFLLYELPVPDMVFFLDIPSEHSKILMKGRKKDIHETDLDYLEQSYQNALHVAEKYDWEKIECIKDGKILEIEEIGKLILGKAMGILD